jgi:ribonuclease HI
MGRPFFLCRRFATLVDMKVIIYTDGGSRGNPGPSALGVYITDAHGKVLKEHKRYLGETTNNQAEYRAIIDGLEQAKELGAVEVEMRMDSELAVKQLNREYRVKDPGLAQLYLRVSNLMTDFSKVTFHHVRREYNKEADRLVNEAIDAHLRRG